MEDTICAIATCVGESSINIIRISGDKAIEIVNKLFDKDLINKPSNSITYGHIIYKNEIIDEVLVSKFISPKSFTTEDVIEINTHGGVSTVTKIMTILQVEGCRLAEPGEFTKRAFLNGRISLTEAEAIEDLITAKNEASRKMAIKAINKNIYNIVKSLKSKIIPLLGNIEVNIDYPEYEDAEIVTKEKIHDTLKDIYDTIDKLIKESETGTIIKNGLNIAIVGKPNVGKSSLLNALLNEEKAIVTDIKGTTRDIVEGQITIEGINVNLYDTAGIRETNDVIEQIGVKKSISTLENADLILFVIDSSNDIEKEDIEIFKRIKDKKVIIVNNKIDKKQSNSNEIQKEFGYKGKINNISALENNNIDLIKEVIKEEFRLNDINTDYTYISNSRQIALLKKCKEIGKNIEEAISNNMPIDIIEIDVKELWDTLGEINGDTYKEELLDEIFSRFCLGK